MVSSESERSHSGAQVGSGSLGGVFGDMALGRGQSSVPLIIPTQSLRLVDIQGVKSEGLQCELCVMSDWSEGSLSGTD